MPKVDDETLRKRFEKAKADWAERQKANRAQKRREKAQADARRKTLIGDMVLAHVKDNPPEHDRLMKRLDVYLKDPKDRSLLDLPPKPAASDSAAPENLPTLVYKPRK